jgi:serine/threonine protein kinase
MEKLKDDYIKKKYEDPMKNFTFK